jgi:hypothetical protein
MSLIVEVESGHLSAAAFAYFPGLQRELSRVVIET